MPRKKAFTLIELLVVIAIIALLMAILMPALARAKKQAKAVVCQSQLKQWGLIWAMYTQDNDGYFHRGWEPGPSNPVRMDRLWITALWPYYKNGKEMLFCPMAKNPGSSTGLKYGVWGPGPVGSVIATEEIYGSYGFNCWACNPFGSNIQGGNDPKLCWRTPAVKGAGNVPLFIDASYNRLFPQQWDEPPQYEGDLTVGEPGNRPIKICCVDRHSGAVNVLLLDWSVRRVGLKGLWKLKWHRDYDTNAEPPVWPDWMKGMKDYVQ